MYNIFMIKTSKSKRFFERKFPYTMIILAAVQRWYK